MNVDAILAVSTTLTGMAFLLAIIIGWLFLNWLYEEYQAVIWVALGLGLSWLTGLFLV